MVKKFSAMALAALIAWPAVAGATATPAELEAQIERLTKELSAMKADMANIKKDGGSSDVEALKEKSEKWDEAARIQLSGDFRTRLDYVSAEAPDAYTAMTVGQGVVAFPVWMSDTTAGKSTMANNMTTILPAFGMTPATPLSVFGPALQTTPKANFIAGAQAAGLTALEANNMATILYNPAVGQMLSSLPATTPVSSIPTIFAGALSGQGNVEKLVNMMKSFTPAERASLFRGLGAQYVPVKGQDYDNDTMWTNRLRVNLRAKATEDLEFKARLAMYKSWGMENNPVDYQYNAGNGGGPFMLNSLSFDGNSTRQPEDNALRVDRAFMNWNNLGGSSAWFSIGRRPTTDGPPSQFRMGADDRLATPVAYMDYPFDGLSLGYGYKSLFGMEDFPGKIRFCYGRGFESGPQNGESNSVNDTDFAGLSWDVYDKDGRFFSIQSFAAMNMFNVPDGVDFVNPLEYAFWQADPTAKFYDPLNPNNNMTLDRKNLGNIYHTDAVYYNTINSFNYFLAAGWSRTKANGVDEMGTSLLGSWWDNPSDKNGYSVYTGMRYDIPNQPLKVGLEYNYGTKNWIAFTPGNDDLYASKLATRGHVIEAYGLWNIPAGEAISKFGKAFMRLGYQHYMYNYTGSGFWLGEPQDIDQLKNDPMAAQFYTPVDTMDQVYLSLEAWF